MFGPKKYIFDFWESFKDFQIFHYQKILDFQKNLRKSLIFENIYFSNQIFFMKKSRFFLVFFHAFWLFLKSRKHVGAPFGALFPDSLQRVKKITSFHSILPVWQQSDS